MFQMPNALRGKYPIMCHAHEKVHWTYVDTPGHGSRGSLHRMSLKFCGGGGEEK